ncbi:MAG: glutamate racemase, partial [Variovorax sp.]|nr:glutamate racemase [Variovorax sp.]
GGLSILNALRAALPHERFVYFADTGHAPYGERGDAYVVERSRAIAHELLARRGAKALVVACNTATAAAIHTLRAEHPGLPLVGVEPALKPALASSATRRIAVLATRVTLASAKFRTLHASMAGQADFVRVACDGLARAIERDDAPEFMALCARYTRAAGTFGTQAGQIDTLVLGCTHYPFVADELQRHTGAAVRFIDTGWPVAQQTQRLLAAAGLLASGRRGAVALVTTGDASALDAAASRWLQAPGGTVPDAAPRTVATL